MTMNAMRPARNYDFTEITRLLLKMRDNCVRKAEGEAYDDPERKEKYEALEAAIDLINNPSMLQRWISVKDALPEMEGKYIVCTAKGSVYCAKFSTRHGPCFHTDMYTHITHWMPLPVPPEEEV